MSVLRRPSSERSPYASGGTMMQSDVIFQEMYKSTMGKAAKISPQIQGVTLGPKALETNILETNETFTDLPTLSSTPKKVRLSDRVMRRPKKLSNYNLNESNSTEEAVKKTLMSELMKKQAIEADKLVNNLESETKVKEKEIFDKLSHMYISERSKREAQTALIEKTILQKLLSQEQTEEQTNNKDIIEENKAHERSEKVKQSVEEAKKRSAALVEKRKLYDAMATWQTNYSIEYAKVTEALKNCKHLDAIKDVIIPLLRKVQDDTPILESILIKCQAEELTPNDLKTADLVMKPLVTLLNAIKTESKKIDDALAEKEREEKKKAEDEANAKIIEKKETVPQGTSDASILADCFDRDSLGNYTRLREHLLSVQKTLEPLIKDQSMNKFRFELQKAVTMPVNAISAVNAGHMLDKYQKLHNLLMGRPSEGNNSVSPTSHPLGLLFVKDVLAKLFVKQGEMRVASKPESAFELASILVNLWAEFPDFGELVLAHFYEHCPYLAPVFLPQIEGQSDEAYCRSLGYLVINGVIEKQDMFLNRMKGLMRLYSAVIITKPRNRNVPNPLPLKEAWRWLAAILNLQPRPDICPVLIIEMLTVTGCDLMNTYKGQAKKLLAYIIKEYYPRLDQVTPAISKGPLTRLENFLEKTAKEGTIKQPSERLASNFW